MRRPVHIVLTTIRYPEILNDLLTNIRQHGHLDEVKIWVVGDKKTPATSAAIAQEVSRKGLETVFFDVDQQDRWGAAFPFYKLIPYNSDARRVFGYLKAMDEDCEILIAMDDDNFPSEDDFIGGHQKTGKPWSGPMLSEPAKFHNICEYLTMEPPRLVFPRGFPFQLRGHQNQPVTIASPKGATIGITEGLWFDDPDIDATTWLNGKVKGVRYNGPDLFVLDQSTWSPINSQNTSVAREVIPAFIFVTMACPVPGGVLDRYGDIWGGYFLLALLQNTKYHAAFGRPLVHHRRNPHNYVDDLRQEYWGMILTDWLLQLLRNSFQPSSSAIIDRIPELAEFLENQCVSNLPGWCPPEINKFLVSTAENIREWSAACQLVGV